jgi:hypothetical protein
MNANLAEAGCVGSNRRVPQVSLLRPGIPQTKSHWKHPLSSLSLGAQPRDLQFFRPQQPSRLPLHLNHRQPLRGNFQRKRPTVQVLHLWSLSPLHLSQLS